MSNTSSTPVTVEAINDLLTRTDAIERQSPAWTRGDIKLWYRPIADLPSGWWPCDGTAAPDGVTTPDLRGRFPVGLSAAAAFDTLGETGGATTANLFHHHDGASHVHGFGGLVLSGLTAVATPAGGAVSTGAGATADPTLHKHGPGTLIITGNTDVPSAGSTSDSLSATQSILPPYAVVHFAYRYV